MYNADRIIEKSRKNLKELIDLHEAWLAGKSEGLQVFNYDEVVRKYNMTDAEIIQYFLDEGYEIEGAEKYIKKED